ncbi:hypothetical protein, partial [Cohnella soli]
YYAGRINSAESSHLGRELLRGTHYFDRQQPLGAGVTARNTLIRSSAATWGGSYYAGRINSAESSHLGRELLRGTHYFDRQQPLGAEVTSRNTLIRSSATIWGGSYFAEHINSAVSSHLGRERAGQVRLRFGGILNQSRSIHLC